MRQHQLLRRCLAVLLCLLSIAHAPFSAAAIDPELARELAHLAPYEEVSVIVTLKEMERPEAYSARKRSKRNGNLVKALKQHAKSTQPLIKSYLNRRRAKNLKEFWIINGLAVTVRADQVDELAAQPGVVSVRHDTVVSFAAPLEATGSAPPEWNLTAVHLPDLWAAGHTGTGVVVATMDTGVDTSHADLADKWRGGGNSWFDPNAEHADPYDAIGHGTQVMGLLVGGSASGIRIGAAPDAHFIAAKIFNDAGKSSYSAIHASFQWLLDPDNDPGTQDAPDVVNASWGLPGTSNKCNVEFDTDIRLLKAAGIAVVFAGGNDGPAPATGVSPASSAGVISSGAVNAALDIANFSSRGPSPCSGGVFPTLVAPGEGIYTSDITSGGISAYTTVSGSSFALPHVAGAMALLAGGFPDLAVTDLETALTQTAQDMGAAGADNSYGLGLVNAGTALQALANRPAGSTPIVTSLPPIVAMQGAAYTYQVEANDADGDSLAFSLDDFPSGMSINATGQIFWVPGSTQAGQQLVTVRVTDSTGLYATQPYVVVVASVNEAPVANDDIYYMTQATTLSVPASGVLTNDTDRDSNRLVAVSYGPASTGTVMGNEDGSFDYNPPSPAFSGIVTFAYRASDGALSSAAATVTINVLANEAGTLTLPDAFPIDSVSAPTVPVQIFPDQAMSGAGENSGVQPAEEVAASEPAFEQAPAQGGGSAPTFTSAPATAATQGTTYAYQVSASDDEGSALVFALDVAPEGMTISEDGQITWVPENAQVGKKLVVVRVTDAANLFATQAYTVVVENSNDAPVAANDSFTLVQASNFNVAAPGVLGNDTDADLTPLVAVSFGLASTGAVAGNSNGSFNYTPPTPAFTGPVTFTYQASDGELTSDAATVTVNVIANRAPLVKDDHVSAPARRAGAAYKAMPIKVLGNDADPDSGLDSANKIAPQMLTIATQPNNHGTLAVSQTGVVSYTPAINFVGVETFSYMVKDTRNALSKTAVVRINVK